MPKPSPHYNNLLVPTMSRLATIAQLPDTANIVVRQIRTALIEGSTLKTCREYEREHGAGYSLAGVAEETIAAFDEGVREVRELVETAVLEENPTEALLAIKPKVETIRQRLQQYIEQPRT